MASLDDDVKSQLKEVESMLVQMDNFYGNLEDVDYEEVNASMTPVERARYNITIAYAINSLFWMYLRSMGEDPKTHKVKDELDRIKTQIQRLQQVNDKAKRPKVDTEAAARMIRHGINEAKKARKRKPAEEENWEDEPAQGDSGKSGSDGATSQKKQK